MKTTYTLSLIAALILTSQTVSAKGDFSWSVGARQHAEQPDFPEIPFGDDLSYGLAIQADDAGGFWQAAVLYTPEIENRDDVDYVITPQINLILSENAWRLGVGGAKPYIKSDSSDNGWADFYWQLIAGLGLPNVGRLKLELQAVYVFDEWGNVGEFDSGNLEYALWIGLPF